MFDELFRVVKEDGDESIKSSIVDKINTESDCGNTIFFSMSFSLFNNNTQRNSLFHQNLVFLDTCINCDTMLLLCSDTGNVSIQVVFFNIERLFFSNRQAHRLTDVTVHSL